MYIVLLFIASVIFIAGVILYKIIRPKFSIKVNCWFCNNNTVVPYGNRNCWDCPHCDQYNGFSQDGDYNKSIPSQYDESLNFSASTFSPEQPMNSSVNGFCKFCIRKQELKIAALASFEAKDQINFDSELESYKQHLDHIYKLCHQCEVQLRQTLFKQDSHLRAKLLSWKLEQNLNFSSASKYVPLLSKSKKYSFHLRMLSLFLIMFSFFGHLYYIEQYAIFGHYLKMDTTIKNYSTLMNKHNHTLCGIGLVTFILVLLLDKSRLILLDGIGLLFWTCYFLNPFVSPYLPTNVDVNCIWLICSALTFLLVLLSSIPSRTPPKVYKFYKQKTFGTYEETKSSFTESFKDTSSNDDATEYHEISAVLPKQTDTLNTSLGAMSLGNSYPLTSLRKQHEGMFVLQSYSTSKPQLFTESSLKNIIKTDDFPRRRPLLSPARFQPQKSLVFQQTKYNMNCWGFPYTVKRDYWIDNMNPYPGFYSYQQSSPVYRSPSPFSSQGVIYPWSASKLYNGSYSSSLPTSRKGSVCGDDRTSVYSEIQYTPYGMFTSDAPPPYSECVKSNHSFDTASNSSHSSSTKCSADDSSNPNTSCDSGCGDQNNLSWKVKLMLILSLSTNFVAISYTAAEYFFPSLLSYFLNKS